jgi:hypothetical protein
MPHAVIVAGHAIPRDYHNPLDDASWHLLAFQRHEAHCYVEHVRHGVELAARDPAAHLIFSGGQTRAEAGPRSEAQGYYWLADHFGWWGHREVAARALTEEFARDSFENVLFSLARFREFSGEWPEHLTVVSWRFKQERFALHRDTIGWPAERYTYAGPNDPPELAQAIAAETRNREAYERDPYSASPEFRAKKQTRNPFRRQHGYHLSCPELAELLAHEGPALFTGFLPWLPNEK